MEMNHYGINRNSAAAELVGGPALCRRGANTQGIKLLLNSCLLLLFSCSGTKSFTDEMHNAGGDEYRLLYVAKNTEVFALTSILVFESKNPFDSAVYIRYAKQIDTFYIKQLEYSWSFT